MYTKLTLMTALIAIILILVAGTEIVIDQMTDQHRQLPALLRHAFGSVGMLLVALSLAGYMIKKSWRDLPWMQSEWLHVHQWFSALSVVFIIAHAGAGLGATLPLATIAFMFLTLFSGFVGRFVFRSVKNKLAVLRGELTQSGLSPDKVEDIIVVAAATDGAMIMWRTVHRVLSLILAVILVAHIISALYYGG